MAMLDSEVYHSAIPRSHLYRENSYPITPPVPAPAPHTLVVVVGTFRGGITSQKLHFLSREMAERAEQEMKGNFYSFDAFIFEGRL